MSSAASLHPSDQLLFTGYDPGSFYDELIAPNGQPRPCAAAMYEQLATMPLEVFEERRKLADLSYLVQGITFTVYSDGRGTERLFPFDLVPRIIPRSEWDVIERGLAQRVMALNLLSAGCLRAAAHPERPHHSAQSGLLLQAFPPRNGGAQRSARNLCPRVAASIWCAIRGTGQYLVLEDNARSPSGISYVLENRLVMRRTFPRAFEASEVHAGRSLSRRNSPAFCAAFRRAPASGRSSCC